MCGNLGGFGHTSDSIEVTTSESSGRDSQTTPKPTRLAACAMRGCVAMALDFDQSICFAALCKLSIASELLNNQTDPNPKLNK